MAPICCRLTVNVHVSVYVFVCVCVCVYVWMGVTYVGREGKGRVVEARLAGQGR